MKRTPTSRLALGAEECWVHFLLWTFSWKMVFIFVWAWTINRIGRDFQVLRSSVPGIQSRSTGPATPLLAPPRLPMKMLWRNAKLPISPCTSLIKTMPDGLSVSRNRSHALIIDEKFAIGAIFNVKTEHCIWNGKDSVKLNENAQAFSRTMDRFGLETRAVYTIRTETVSKNKNGPLRFVSNNGFHTDQHTTAWKKLHQTNHSLQYTCAFISANGSYLFPTRYNSLLHGKARFGDVMIAEKDTKANSLCSAIPMNDPKVATIGDPLALVALSNVYQWVWSFQFMHFFWKFVNDEFGEITQ